jgi:hypothetical protein
MQLPETLEQSVDVAVALDAQTSGFLVIAPAQAIAAWSCSLAVVGHD